VEKASVEIFEVGTRKIGKGMMVLLGVGRADSPEDVEWLAGKVSAIRLFEDSDGRTNKDLREIGGEVMVVSQFTLLASTRKGNRPSFDPAAPPELAVPLYEMFTLKLSEMLGIPVVTGQFGAHMKVSLVNDGPLTIIIDSKARE
jgi:D-tyrosyl-tRNA(Tyr) deacylase